MQQLGKIYIEDSVSTSSPIMWHHPHFEFYGALKCLYVVEHVVLSQLISTLIEFQRQHIGDLVWDILTVTDTGMPSETSFDSQNQKYFVELVTG